MWLFPISYIAGIVIGVPVGVAGAIVADSALAHNKRQLITTIIAVAMGDTVLAAIVGLFFRIIDEFVVKYRSPLLLGGSIVLFTVGMVLTYKALTHDDLPDPNKEKGPLHYMLQRYAPGVAAFGISVLHPGSLIAMAWVASLVVANLPEGTDFIPWIFSLGIGGGSLSIFAVSGLIFWKIRKKAGNFVRALRFLLAGCVFCASIVMFFSYINP